MKKTRKLLSIWEHYITMEIGIEFKACLYFFCILFFYSVYKVIDGSLEANIIHMTEMIFLTYVMGYVQVYLLSNFDEGEQLRGRELFYMVLCTGIYTVISFLGKWFDQNIAVTIGFAFYMIAVYLCAFIVYQSKRRIDEKLLNEELQAFQERQGENEQRH